jgi:magnesium-transporting ATPase (P-type)
MFDYDPHKEKRPTDWSGTIIGLLLTPVFFLIAFLSNADMALGACIVLGMIMIAIKIRWNLRRHLWFWATIVFILVLQVPLVFMFQWPQGKGPTLLYTMPIGIADFLIILGAVALAEKIFAKESSVDENG